MKMSEELGLKILSNLRDHHKNGSAAYKEDVELAVELGQETAEIQTQLDLLEKKGLVSLVKAFGPSYGAIITPQGLDHLEQIED